MESETQKATFAKAAVLRMFSPSTFIGIWVEKRCTCNRENHNLDIIQKWSPFKNMGEIDKKWTVAGVRAWRATRHRQARSDSKSLEIKGKGQITFLNLLEVHRLWCLMEMQQDSAQTHELDWPANWRSTCLFSPMYLHIHASWAV